MNTLYIKLQLSYCSTCIPGLVGQIAHGNRSQPNKSPTARERFSRIGDIKDLEEAIRLAKLALSATPNDHPNRAHYLNNLEVYLRNQFLRTGEMEQLEEGWRACGLMEED